MKAMRIRRSLLGMVVCFTLASAFTSCNRKTVSRETPDEQITGNDRDEHGCIGSAGYTWSELLQECIRTWEKGVELTDVQHVGATGAAFLVPGATEAEKELFLPGAESGILLSKKGKKWTDADSSYEVLEPLPQSFEVYDAQGVLLFKTMTE